MLPQLFLALALASLVSALPSPASLPPLRGRQSDQAISKANSDLGSSSTSFRRRRRPVVIWHGLGDSAGSEGMLSVKADIEALYPDIFVHNVFISEDEGEDRKAGFFGDANKHIELVAAQLAAIPALDEGFSALGFSQGGQFLRAYVELYNEPPVHTLVTFGSQHMGISDIPTCRPTDFICKLASSAARRGVYTPYAQKNLIQAQYWRDPDHLETYLAKNTFLAPLNNELPRRNPLYASNLASLSNLVLLRFTNETTVYPAVSSWFGSLAPSTPSSSLDTTEVPLEQQPLYVDGDRLGLRALNEAGKLKREWCEGEHMQIGGCWERVLRDWVGGWVGEEEEGEGEEGGGLVVQG